MTFEEFECLEDVALGQKHFENLIVRFQSLQHVQGELMGWWVDGFEGQQLTCDVHRVSDDVILQELMQLIVAIVADEQVDDEFVEVRVH